ncbi:TniQ family protein [Deinococcus sp. NW-56]|uniref:TniQ family protein n=1 Tax=Deinococcus sp. NW-56 TaxID=2080419 RepID=UPI000CF57952|nr:TniQ family protein [Deinococcus sp. NW-56]
MNRLHLGHLSVGRELGLRCDPIPGESFPSYAERLCLCQPPSTEASVNLLLARTGLVPAEHHKARLYGYGTALSPEHLERFARVTGNSEKVIGATLLTHYAGVCLTLPDVTSADPDFARALAHGNWVYGAGTHVGPCCLAAPWADAPDGVEHDGLQRAWMLRWKLPWVFLCPEHERFLLGVCPRCGQRPGNHRNDLGAMPRFSSLPPRAGVCMNPRAPGERGAGRDSLPCGYDLTKAPVTRVSQVRLLETQCTLDRILAGQTPEVDGHPIAPLEVFEHLRSLVSLALHVARADDLGPLQPEVEAAFERHTRKREAARGNKTPGRKGTPVHPYKAAPTDPLLMAATLPLAMDILMAPGRAEREARIAGLAARVREVKRGQAWQLAEYFHFTGPVLEAYGAQLTANAQTPRRLGRHAHNRKPYSCTADHIPPQLWPEIYRERFAHFFVASDTWTDKKIGLLETSARRFISMMLAQVVASLDRVGAAQALGLPPSHAAGLYNKAMGIVRAGGHLEAFDAALVALAEELSAREHRVNYKARRQALAGFCEVTPEQWASMRVTRGTGSAAQRRGAAAWIWSSLVLLDPLDSPALTTKDHRERAARIAGYARFRQVYLEVLRPDLDELAHQVLAQAMRPA